MRDGHRGGTHKGCGGGMRSAIGRLCCKSIFGIWSRNIDSRSGTNEQQRFKRTDAPIRLLQISISQSLLGDFCNTIPPKADKPQTCWHVRFVPQADSSTAACNPRAPGLIRSHRRRSRAGGDSSRLCRHPMFLAAAIPTAMGETSLGACRKAAALV
jgi:hypothetical protein